MPIYEYKCTVCDHRFEQLHLNGNGEKVVCPECGGKVKRLMAPAGIIFKGSGFYITDTRKENTEKKDRSETREKVSD